MKVTCPGCRTRVRFTQDHRLVEHISSFHAPCILFGKDWPSEKPLPTGNDVAPALARRL